MRHTDSIVGKPANSAGETRIRALPLQHLLGEIHPAGEASRPTLGHVPLETPPAALQRTWEDLCRGCRVRLWMTQVLGRGPREAVIGESGILLPDHQGLGQALGSLLIVLHSDLQKKVCRKEFT